MRYPFWKPPNRRLSKKTPQIECFQSVLAPQTEPNMIQNASKIDCVQSVLAPKTEPKMVRNASQTDGFQSVLASKTEPKSKKKGRKRDAKKQCIFKSIFIGIFFALASENGMKIQCFLDLYRKSWFCENHCFPQGKLLFFWFRASHNRQNFDVKTLSKMTSRNKSSKIKFGHRFGFPKTIKMAPKSDVKRSLFRDAMQLTCTSSEINGTRRL